MDLEGGIDGPDECPDAEWRKGERRGEREEKEARGQGGASSAIGNTGRGQAWGWGHEKSGG